MASWTSTRRTAPVRVGLLAGLLLALAAAGYQLAAWLVVPGFYDGIAPVAPYRWVSPPAQFRATNQLPLNGHATIKVGSGGQVEAGSAATQDGQASLSFPQGTFATPPDRSPVTIDVAPQLAFPAPGSVHLATNVYCFTSNARIAAGKQALVTLQFSSQLTAPSDVYEYQGTGPWQKIGNAGAAAPYYIAANATTLGCFAGGYVGSAPQAGAGGGGQTLPIVAGLAIVVVVLAAVPLLVLRRRGQEEDEE